MGCDLKRTSLCTCAILQHNVLLIRIRRENVSKYLRFQVNGKESIANSCYDESRETEPDSRDAENVQDRDLLLGGMPATILRSFIRCWCRKIILCWQKVPIKKHNSDWLTRFDGYLYDLVNDLVKTTFDKT